MEFFNPNTVQVTTANVSRGNTHFLTVIVDEFTDPCMGHAVVDKLNSGLGFIERVDYDTASLPGKIVLMIQLTGPSMEVAKKAIQEFFDPWLNKYLNQVQN